MLLPGMPISNCRGMLVCGYGKSYARILPRLNIMLYDTIFSLPCKARSTYIVHIHSHAIISKFQEPAIIILLKWFSIIYFPWGVLFWYMLSLTFVVHSIFVLLRKLSKNKHFFSASKVWIANLFIDNSHSLCSRFQGPVMIHIITWEIRDVLLVFCFRRPMMW